MKYLSRTILILIIPFVLLACVGSWAVRLLQLDKLHNDVQREFVSFWQIWNKGPHS